MEESYWRIIAGESSKLGFTRSEISCGSSLVERLDHLSTGPVNTVCYMLLLIFYSFLDINECELEGQCIDGTCVNTPGSFRCQCPPNYQLDASGRICKGDFHFTLGWTKFLFSTLTAVIQEDEFKNYSHPLTWKSPWFFVMSCFTDKRTAYCWTKITNDRCEEAINGPVTLEICCNTVGKGWGSPCEECPAKTGGKLW